MKIALIAPSPVPFAIGGAENLFWGLQNYINENTRHQCELIKIPSPETNLGELINSYQNFSAINLDHFDVVVSTKYPSWMVKHDNHICYLLHRLRGLYDTYRFTGHPLNVQWDKDEMRAAKKLSLDLVNLGSNNLNASFDLCSKFLMEHVDSKIIKFPGPFSRWLIHHFDSIGMDPERISKYAAISNVVKNRGGYFPKGVPVSVLYPPPRLSGFYCGSVDYLFTVSRLDGPKRIRLLIEAMKYVKSAIPLLIAGTGPDEVEIKKLADGDKRIQFLGFVNDKDLIDYYANALAIPFIPYDEDYGLITIEAMKSSKPVITCTDSGGSNEFVKNGINGFSVDPNPKSLAERIDYLCLNRAEAREMGVNARSFVDHINWDYVVNGLFSADKPTTAIPILGNAVKKKKMLVAVTFPIYPPRGGGQVRVYNLYKNLAEEYDIEIHSLCAYGQPAFDEFIAPGLREIRTPVSYEHQLSESSISRKVDWIPITDIVAGELVSQTPEYLSKLESSISTADILVACHPFLGRVLHKMAPNIEFWLEAQDVELLIKMQLLPASDEGAKLISLTKDVEGYCLQKARIVFACSKADLKSLEEMYGDKILNGIVVPNGADIKLIPFVEQMERGRRKELLGFGSNQVALFMGSWHEPNIKAAKHILTYADKCKSTIFCLMGSVCNALKGQIIPENVRLLGVLSDQEKVVVLGMADIALNPMEIGSGSSLKIFDYFSAGILVLSTKFGMRGIEAESELHYRKVEIEEFPAGINGIKSSEEYKEVILAARELVLEKYDWSKISKDFIQQLKIIE